MFLHRGDYLFSVQYCPTVPHERVTMRSTWQHPFTTIDPNVGYCLVPAPEGSCPEDGYAPKGAPPLSIGSTHGRDPRGRRLLPVLLKDVAGLVPGAYQGRGRGNQFLNDLTDANVLIHVVDGSGTSDVTGNPRGVESDGTTAVTTDPLVDLAWIRNELIEWVYSNVVYKWDAIRAKGQDRLAKMFSGYGQPQTVTVDVLSGVEKYMESQRGRDRALANLGQWNEADVHRLVSTFLGVRFPMALAINKCDIGTSTQYVRKILDLLPIHGAHVGVPMCAKSEMLFVRSMICKAQGMPSSTTDNEDERGNPPNAVWRCLQGAMELKEPVLVFPVVDFTTYASLPGLGRHATEDASLPSAGMVACIQEAGGTAPSLWNETQRCYAPQTKRSCMPESTALRDVLVMKPGSTVDDCYVVLKRLGAVAGDFVRAEAAGDIGSAPKQIPKNQVMTKSLRILKVMTKRKTSWQ
jgi:ribosome-binding ATPase